MVEALRASILFLSRLPVINGESPADVPDFRRTAHAFAPAGAVIALPAACVAWISLMLGLTPLVTGILAVATLVIVTGALHEDGLADVADGFWGGFTRERKLEIMRDSHIGAYGVIALVLSLGLRVALIAAIASAVPAPATAPAHASLVVPIVLVCAAALSRAAMLYPWSSLPPARPSSGEESDSASKQTSGLSARYGAPDSSTYLSGALWSLPFLALLIWVCGLWAGLAGLILLKLSALAARAMMRHHIGGHTGDTLGATQQICELGLLLGLASAM